MAETNDRYELTWPGKLLARELATSPPTGTLVPAESDAPHTLIEGDNLEVLKLLQARYSERIKLIYIDPPYNTGGDFVYQDRFQEALRDYQRTRQTGETD